MKANELRMFNWVHNSINKVDFQIDCFLGHEWCTNICEFDSQEFDSKIEDLKPIPLTEEWLLKFGFIKVTYTVSLSDGGMPYHYELEGQGNHWRLYFDGRFFAFNERKLNLHLSHNRYVHQLQNLYFALTGEELKIREDESKTD